MPGESAIIGRARKELYMSSVGFPNFGPEYTGFLHRHPPRPGYPDTHRHVVVDVEDWVIARQKAAESPATSTNTGIDAIALWKEYLSAVEHDYRVSWLKSNIDRVNAVIAQQHHT